MNTTKPAEEPSESTVSETEATQVASGNPIEVGAAGVRGGAHVYGACSIEKGCGCSFGALSDTHEDAGGWLAYLGKFYTANFWFRDCDVKPWIYYEPYDDWQDTYGVDAVMAFYHSGHGGMDGNGVFYLPMSAPWGNQGCTVVSSSNDLQWGNEWLRYIFLSTCLSCRVLEGHSPIRTWHKSNRGWRMLFGFETVSWDSPDYGKFFWEEWNRNKSFSTAWLDASWRIAHDQAPSAVACGATAAEAQNRLFNERFLSWDRVSNAWYWWRWYYASKSAREPEVRLPRALLVGRLQPPEAARQPARALAERFQMGLKVPAEVPTARDGSYSISEGDKSIAYGRDGSIDVQLAKPNLANRTTLPPQRAAELARQAVARYELDREAPIVPDRVVSLMEAGATANGSGRLEGPYETGTIVQFRQLINGMPVISPDAGTVRLTLDNDGTVTKVHSSIRAVEQLRSRATRSVSEPTPEGGTPPTQSPEPDNFERRLDAAFSQRMAIATAKAGGGLPLEVSTVPGSVEIGYDIDGNDATLIARKAVEVNFGGGYRKRYWVIIPLFE